MTDKKRRDYCFTINNYSDDDLEELKKLEDHKQTRYIIAGQEVGEEGTKHIQGYVYFHIQTAFSTVKKMLSRAHIEACRGTPEDNIAYCSKDGEFYEKGEKPVSQKRKGELEKERWDDIKDKAKRGKLDEIPSDIFVKHYRTIRAIEKDYAEMPPDADDTTGKWYYGETGTGKSYKARDENKGAYLKMCNKWWDSYAGEDTVIVEDFDKQHAVLGHHLKIWADRYAFPAEIKGGKINIRPKLIIVTSNWHPKEIWGTEPQTLEPILRRFDVTHFN